MQPGRPLGLKPQRRFQGENPTSSAQIYYSLKRRANRIRLKVTDMSGETIHEFEASTEPGLHRVSWDMRRPLPEGRRSRYRRGGPRIAPGTYIVELAVDNVTLKQELVVEGDPKYPDVRFRGEGYHE